MSRFILRTNRPKKDGRVTLTFNGYVHGIRVFHGTGISVRPEDWDELRQQVKRSDAGYSHKNIQLREIDRRFEAEAHLQKSSSGMVDVDALKRAISGKMLDGTPIVEPVKSFWEYYSEFLTSKRNERGERTIAKYKTLETLLLEAAKGKGAVKFENLDHSFYDKFKNHLLRKRKHTNNTVGKYVSTLKTFLAWAEERGAPVHPSYRRFKVDEEDVEVVALTWEELQLIIDVDLSAQPRLDKVRDLFLFACYTGARFSDVQSIIKDDIHDGTWHLRTLKTKSEIRIHLTPRAMEILQKYQARNEWLPRISSQRMNDYLKEIGKIVGLIEPVRIVRYQGAKRIEDRGPKWEYLTSHVARRTFVTLSLEKGMRPEVVMSITGHRSFKTMKKYIALNENGRREDMNNAWA